MENFPREKKGDLEERWEEQISVRDVDAYHGQREDENAYLEDGVQACAYHAREQAVQNDEAAEGRIPGGKEKHLDLSVAFWKSDLCAHEDAHDDGPGEHLHDVQKAHWRAAEACGASEAHDDGQQELPPLFGWAEAVLLDLRLHPGDAFGGHQQEACCDLRQVPFADAWKTSAGRWVLLCPAQVGHCLLLVLLVLGDHRGDGATHIVLLVLLGCAHEVYPVVHGGIDCLRGAAVVHLVAVQNCEVVLGGALKKEAAH